MKTKPILFQGDMVRSILDGAKTQTRRVMKDQPPGGDCRALHEVVWGDGAEKISASRDERRSRAWAGFTDSRAAGSVAYYGCPYGQPGDLLWVREAWAYHGCSSQCHPPGANLAHVSYLADSARRDVPFDSFDEMHSSVPQQNIKHPEGFDDLSPEDQHLKHYELIDTWWSRQKRKPSIHMPRWASRLTLEITDLRVERVQDISEADAEAEGAPETACLVDDQPTASAIAGFMNIWKSINGDGSWYASPWVWVIEFRAIHDNVDNVLRQREAT